MDNATSRTIVEAMGGNPTINEAAMVARAIGVSIDSLLSLTVGSLSWVQLRELCVTLRVSSDTLLGLA